MPFLSDLSTVTVTGQFYDLVTNRPLDGTVTFAPIGIIKKATGGKLLLPSAYTAKVTAGQLSIELPVTDDPDYTPGFYYAVTESLSGVSQNRAPYSLLLPSTLAGQTFDLITAQQLASPPQFTAVMPTSGGNFSGAFGLLPSGSTQPKWQLDINGQLDWGSGSAATDTTLYRVAAGQLKTDTAFIAGTQLGVGGAPITGDGITVSQAADAAGVRVTNTVAGGNLNTPLFRGDAVNSSSLWATARVTGDTTSRWIMRADGQMQWGSGAAARDVTLSRTGAGELTVSGTLKTAGGKVASLAWYNVKDYGAKGDGSTNDTAAIQAAINAANTAGRGTIYFPASTGAYRVTGLTVYSNLRLLGDGMSSGTGSEIKMLGDTAHCIYGANVSFLTISDINIFGTAGTTLGSYDGIFLESTVTTAQTNIALTNVLVNGFSRNGINIANSITSTFTNVRAQTIGGIGFNFDIATSLTFLACYANSCATGGYRLNQGTYSSLSGCACDSSGYAYLLQTCKNVTLASCGCEAITNTGFELNAGSCNTLQSCYENGNQAVGVKITNTSTFNQVSAFRELGPRAGATASIQVASGSSAMVLWPQVTTAESYAASTTRRFGTANLYLTSTTTTAINADRGTTTNFANFLLSTAGADRWAIGLRNTSTNDLIVFNSNQGAGALLIEDRTTAPNISLLTSTKDYGGGVGVLYVPNVSTAPTTNPTAGGILYISNGALTYRGSSGTVTTVAPA